MSEVHGYYYVRNPRSVGALVEKSRKTQLYVTKCGKFDLKMVERQKTVVLTDHGQRSCAQRKRLA
jgi:hypothetical protein